MLFRGCKSQLYARRCVWNENCWVLGFSRTFYDRRLAQEVSGDNLGDVSSHNLHYPCSFINQFYFPFGAYWPKLSSRMSRSVLTIWLPLLMLAVFCRSSRVMCSRLWEVVTSRASPWSRVFLLKDVCGFWCTEVCSSLPCRPESWRLVACYGIWRIVQVFLTYFKD